MAGYDRGAVTPYNYLAAQPVPVYAAAKNFYANRTPLYARLAEKKVGAMSFKVTGDNFRPRTTTINEGGTFTNSDTTLTVADGSSFMPGDVVECQSESMLITAVSGNDLTVSRGYAGTSAASHADTLTVYLVGNTRAGNETEQTGITRIPSTTTQDLQTFQHPWQIGGALASDDAYVVPGGNPTAKSMKDAMQNCADDIETCLYYGRGVSIAGATTRPAMKGCRSLFATNSTTSPVNGSAYKPSDLARDTMQACYAAGGNPDVLLVSVDWMQAFITWGHAAQRLNAGATMFGTPIDVFEVPFLNGLSIIPAPLLRTGSAICLTSSEVALAVKRAMYNKPRGSRGDADEGDVIAEHALWVENEAHHAYLTGVSGFSV